MQLRNSIRSTLVVLLGATTLAASASAGGEPKNEWPFTRPVGNRTTQAATPSSAKEPVIQGEPKNEPPFTRPATVIVQSSGGFSWLDAGIGLVAGIGIAASGVGVLSLAHKSPLTA